MVAIDDEPDEPLRADASTFDLVAVLFIVSFAGSKLLSSATRSNVPAFGT